MRARSDKEELTNLEQSVRTTQNQPVSLGWLRVFRQRLFLCPSREAYLNTKEPSFE